MIYKTSVAQKNGHKKLFPSNYTISPSKTLPAINISLLIGIVEGRYIP